MNLLLQLWVLGVPCIFQTHFLSVESQSHVQDQRDIEIEVEIEIEIR